MDCSCNSLSSADLDYNADMDQSARHLADLLIQTPEYEEFLKVAQGLSLDSEIKRISLQIEQLEIQANSEAFLRIEGLQLEMEALPVIKKYRQAEIALVALLHEVDKRISATAGLAFSANALPRTCG